MAALASQQLQAQAAQHEAAAIQREIAIREQVGQCSLDLLAPMGYLKSKFLSTPMAKQERFVTQWTAFVAYVALVFPETECR